MNELASVWRCEAKKTIYISFVVDARPTFFPTGALFLYLYLIPNRDDLAGLSGLHFEWKKEGTKEEEAKNVI